MNKGTPELRDKDGHLMIGAGKNICLPKGAAILYNPKAKGFCVYDAFRFVGQNLPKRPWYTLN